MQAVIDEVEQLKNCRRGGRSRRRRHVSLAIVSSIIAACTFAVLAWDSDSTSSPAVAAASSPSAPQAPFDAQSQQSLWAKHLNLPASQDHATGIQFRLIPPGQCWLGSSPADIDQMLDQALLFLGSGLDSSAFD